MDDSDSPALASDPHGGLMELEKFTRRLIEAYHDDLDPLQETARRLALTNITAARDTLCIAADPRDRGHERRASRS